MTHGTPPSGNEDNETVALRRSDLPPGGYAGAGQAPTSAQPTAQPAGQPAPPQYGQPAAPQYGPPPQSYGQSQYGQPAAQPPFAPTTTGGRSLGATALVVALIGAAAAAVGLFALRWTKVPDSAGIDTDPKFLDLRRLFVALDNTDLADKPTWTILYFNWAAFVLVGATLVFAILSALPTAATPAFRVIGFVVGLVSAAAAVFVPELDGANDLSEYLKGGLGLYFVAGGSVLMAIAALLGSRRRG